MTIDIVVVKEMINRYQNCLNDIDPKEEYKLVGQYKSGVRDACKYLTEEIESYEKRLLEV